MAIECNQNPMKIKSHNYEKYFREATEYGVFTLEDGVPEFDDFIQYCEKRFKSLYRPYHG